MLIETGAAIVGGGLTGIGGAAITNYLELKKQELVHSHQEKILELKSKITPQQEQTSANDNVNTLNKNENNFINNLRSSVRPIITYALTIYAMIIVWKISTLINIDETNKQIILDIFRDCVSSILYAFVSCTVYWFGTRMKS